VLVFCFAERKAVFGNFEGKRVYLQKEGLAELGEVQAGGEGVVDLGFAP
jgi:hypothetical protein